MEFNNLKGVNAGLFGINEREAFFFILENSLLQIKK